MVGEVRRNAFVASMFALASCVLLPVVLLLSVSGFHVSDTAIPVALLVYSGCRLAVMIYLGEKRPLQGVFWLFVYVTLGVAPLAQVVTGLSQRVAAPDQVIWAYGLVGAGIIAYDIGSLIAKRREGHVVQDRRPHATTLNTGRLVLGSIITVGITAYNIATFGLATYFASRQENAVLVAETVGSADGHAARALVGALDDSPTAHHVAGLDLGLPQATSRERQINLRHETLAVHLRSDKPRREQSDQQLAFLGPDGPCLCLFRYAMGQFGAVPRLDDRRHRCRWCSRSHCWTSSE